MSNKYFVIGGQSINLRTFKSAQVANKFWVEIKTNEGLFGKSYKVKYDFPEETRRDMNDLIDAVNEYNKEQEELSTKALNKKASK